MASNEHAYLSESNLHNPKGLSLANNNTVCSKNNSGILEWKSNSYLAVESIVFSGYCALSSNYQYSSNYHNNNKAPYQMNKDYGSATIDSGTTVAQGLFFKIASYVAPSNAIINSGVVQVTSPGAGSFTIALVKHTISNTLQLAYPVILCEKVVNGLSNDNLVNSYAYDVSVEFQNSSISAGDRIFVMVKGAAEVTDTVYLTTSIQIGYTT